jgi:hypothetical protein
MGRALEVVGSLVAAATAGAGCSSGEASAPVEPVPDSTLPFFLIALGCAIATFVLVRRLK